MKLEKYGVIAEIVGGLAIVVTLIFLIMEVRGNSEAIRAQTAQATFGISAESFYYPEGNLALDKMLLGEELSAEEFSHATSLLAAIFTTFDNHYYQYRQGTLDEEIHEAYRARLELVMESEGVRDFWDLRSPLHTRAFQAYVDAVLENREK